MVRPSELGTGQVWFSTDKTVIHFGSPAQDLIPFVVAEIEKEEPNG